MGTFFLSNEILKASLALLPTADRSELSEQLGMASGNSADEIVRSLSRDSGNSRVPQFAPEPCLKQDVFSAFTATQDPEKLAAVR